MTEDKKPKLSPKVRAAMKKGARRMVLQILRALEDSFATLDKTCDNCKDEAAKEVYTKNVYETPWDDKPILKYFCSPMCRENYLTRGASSYFTCDKCQREIRKRDSKDPWHVHDRKYEGETVCLSCYGDIVKLNGLGGGMD